MKHEDISPMPTPYAEEPQLVPGGVDAIEDDPADNGLSRDLNPEDNPVDDVVPDEVTEPDDKSQAPDGEAGDEESGTSREDEDPSAGQEAEDGSPEPPA
ncbi:hypothetical protein GCM10023339_08090 [Alloalcanivorax gelatiniphagus]